MNDASKKEYIQNWVKHLYEDCENGAADEFVRGWNHALDKVVEILEREDELILEKASETLTMFTTDEELALADRKRFVRNLGKLARQTRDGVSRMELDDHEIVTIKFKNGGEHKVNINMDSYAAIMRDVSKAIN